MNTRSKVIHSLGELAATESLGAASATHEQHPAAIQLRLLSTTVEVSTEKNSRLIFPVPVELLRRADTRAATDPQSEPGQ